MAAVQTQTPSLPQRSNTLVIRPAASSSAPRSTPDAKAGQPKKVSLDAFSPVNQNGSYEFDRVIKSGYVQKRTQKTKTWKSVYLVLRPNILSVYKNEKEDKLRYKLYLSDLTAVAYLKDPKQKRQNVFGLFSPSKNFHFQAPSAKDAKEWVESIRRDARIDEEEEEMFLASPIVRRQSYAAHAPVSQLVGRGKDRIASSSPEPQPTPNRRGTFTAEYSGLSGNELASHSDFSDSELPRPQGPSIESLAVVATTQITTTPPTPNTPAAPGMGPATPPGAASGAGEGSATSGEPSSTNVLRRPTMGNRNPSQSSGLNMDRDPDRVIWQGWLWFLRSKRGVKQWKNMWAVLRPRNLILYKDESEYTAQFILSPSAILSVVDIDPVSKSKSHCLQVITEDKSYRFCAHGEEPLVQCLGAFKSLLARRRELEARVAAAGK